MTRLYDKIGLNYADLRKPDCRIAEQIRAALAGAKCILNIGAGAGSYEPVDFEVTALEPSIEMISQRQPGNAKTAALKTCHFQMIHLMHPWPY